MARAPKSAAASSAAAAKSATGRKKPGRPRAASVQSRPGPKSGASGGNRVAVVGGGIAGMTAALRLIQAGFAVTLFEATTTLGGNTSSTRGGGGVYHDVYPHMFCSWYDNFWDVFERDLGLRREDHFERRDSVRLRRGPDDETQLFNPTSIGAMMASLRAGAMSPAETFLLGYYGLDLVSHPFDRSGFNQLQMLDVNGFLYSRGYATEDVARMENYILQLIWSVQSDQTAAATYQNFLRHSFTFPDGAPFCWLLKDSLRAGLVEPFRQKLIDIGCEIRLGHAVSSVTVDQENRPVLAVGPAASAVSTERFDYAVLAVPATSLARLVMGSGAPLQSERRLVDCEPSLAQVRTILTVSIPVVDLYLNRKLPGFPKEAIGLAGSTYGLTVVDISQLWRSPDFKGKTALVVAASNAAAIPAETPEGDGWLMIQDLARYYPDLKIGKRWGDPDSDIDWVRTHVRTNEHHRLTVNDVGSWPCRPATSYPEKLPRVVFAGDLCQTDVDMATVEAAVESGIQAAREVQAEDARINLSRRGKAIKVKPHTVYSAAAFRAAKLLLLPVAYGALGVAAFQQRRDRAARGSPSLKDGQYSLLEYLLLVPQQFAIDWLKAAYWFGRSLIDEDEGKHSRSAKSNGSGITDNEQASWEGGPRDQTIGLGEAALTMLGECADYAIDRLLRTRRPHHATTREPALDGVLEALFKAGEAALGGGAPPGSKPRRRARVKR